MQPALTSNQNPVPNLTYGPTQIVRSPRNRDRNPRPCGKCSVAKVRCLVSAPYSSLRCKRCEDEGLTECVPPVPKPNSQTGVRHRAPHKRKMKDGPSSSFDVVISFEENISATSDIIGYTQNQSFEKDIDRRGPLRSMTSETAAQIQSSPIRFDGLISTAVPTNNIESVPRPNIGTTSAGTGNSIDALYHNNNITIQNCSAVAQNESYLGMHQPGCSDTGVTWYHKDWDCGPEPVGDWKGLYPKSYLRLQKGHWMEDIYQSQQVFRRVPNEREWVFCAVRFVE
ncbi:hypothetical protein BD410DRAFT_890515 [Rickenella mellea]|uniref:Zn(2)-C6 fungal-type domain-containing protein n=1 Tax=Rickenella mellea TaxID=50990 RepID=A0A4Y7PNH9_9AGAM|nr:hypothetical protein BD410DRAFT_890515 [Rickenella mellea]